jgi:hypothetical protein
MQAFHVFVATTSPLFRHIYLTACHLIPTTWMICRFPQNVAPSSACS